MSKFTDTIAEQAKAYLSALDKAHDAATKISERVGTAADEAVAKLPEKVRPGFAAPRAVVDFNRKVTDKAFELHKAGVTKVLDRLEQPQS